MGREQPQKRRALFCPTAQMPTRRTGGRSVARIMDGRYSFKSVANAWPVKPAKARENSALQHLLHYALYPADTYQQSAV